MAHNFFIDKDTYAWLLHSINNQQLYVGTQAADIDIAFIKDERWISETAVIDRLSKRKGMCCIDLVFANYKNPITLIIRNITAFACEKKAAIHASLFRRQAAKDQRGTINIDVAQYNLMIN